jgi:hypothetical protein
MLHAKLMFVVQLYKTMMYVNNNSYLTVSNKTFSNRQAVVYGSSTAQHHDVEVAFPVS